jgi:hypothetical protein
MLDRDEHHTLWQIELNLAAADPGSLHCYGAGNGAFHAPDAGSCCSVH